MLRLRYFSTIRFVALFNPALRSKAVLVTLKEICEKNLEFDTKVRSEAERL